MPSSCTEEQRNDFYQQRECFECGPDSSDATDNYSGCVKTDTLSSISSTESFYVKFGVTKQRNGASVVPCEQYAPASLPPSPPLFPLSSSSFSLFLDRYTHRGCLCM